ncbi:hypothetical protein [Plantactinospora endophytica]|uniref:Transposase n=1 Tax=Plantactinospora endophytica TaxID=673535 RepID=A0ABQ4DTC2_9ACTN|nr:hypothetical protein [Plantactinospora endophytica]GIG85706.1 hypothetical protein Pen02_06420 [Plantactinospora endophytica]
MAGLPRDLVERLYAAPPDGFVAARAEAVAAARAAGDPAAAREIAKLRKPTVAAWLVNLLALRRPELMAELVELSAALRTAQRELRGDRLRELSVRRRGVVSALVGQARTLAEQADPRPAAGKLPLAEVEATLNAALADVEVAEQARSGRLVRAASYAGFGEVPRPQLRLIVGGPDTEDEPTGDELTGADVAELTESGLAERAERRVAGLAGGTADERAEAVVDESVRATPRTGRRAGGRTAAEQETARGRGTGAGAAGTSAAERAAVRAARAEESARAARRRALDRALADAGTRQERAEAELAAAVAAERDGVAALAAIESELAELERRRAAAERESGRRKLARRAAERGAVAARRRVGEVQAAVEALAAEDGDDPR